MDISCPQCAAGYRVPERLVAARRSLRCAACGHAWVPHALAGAAAPPPPPTQAAAAPPAPAPSAPAIPERAIPERAIPERAIAERAIAARAARLSAAARALALRVKPLGLAWAGSVAAVAVGLLLLVTHSRTIAAAWPPYQRVALLLGG